MNTASHLSDLWSVLLDLDIVRRLVRQGVGCQCPEEVFDDVVIGRPTVFAETVPGSAVQLLIGRRLLVSLVEVDWLVDVRSAAEQLLMRGREVRDAHGLNRFRLVLIGRCEPGVIESLSASASRIDDRLHVHVLEPEALPALLRRCAPTRCSVGAHWDLARLGRRLLGQPHLT